MGRHKANHIQVAYAPDAGGANHRPNFLRMELAGLASEPSATLAPGAEI